jgi:hypothetical protein
VLCGYISTTSITKRGQEVHKSHKSMAEGFYQTLKSLLARPKEEFHEFGHKAKQFVLAHKSNYKQARGDLSEVEDSGYMCQYYDEAATDVPYA